MRKKGNAMPSERGKKFTYLIEVYDRTFSTSARVSCFYGSQNFKISHCDHDVILRGDVNHFMFSMLPC